MTRKAIVVIPIAVWVLLCLAEWGMWLKPPYAFFYARGVRVPNVSYHATTVGDLVAGNIFVTPVPRVCWYVTDRYGTRNTFLPKEADILIFGDSFAYGAGNSHEDTPSVQLSRITGKKVILTGHPHSFKASGSMDIAAYLIKHQWPLRGKVFLYFTLDGDLLEPPWKVDPAIAVKEVFAPTGNVTSYTWREKFNDFKKYVRDYSPQAIIARKLKTNFETKTLSFLYQHKVFARQSKSLDYLDHDGKVYGFIKTWPEIEKFDPQTPKLVQTVNGLKMLHDEARKLGVVFIPVIIPRKQIVYHKYINDGIHIDGYGPGQILYDRLKKTGVDAVFLHPAIFKAVREEMEQGQKAVYWSDDTHWSPYGIAIASQIIKEFLKQKGLL